MIQKVLYIYRCDLQSISLPADVLYGVHDGSRYKSVVVTVKANKESDQNGKEYDFYSRNFAPWNGIPEDPVTGKPVVINVKPG